MEKIVIIGGGVAGLSCMNALLDKQISPLLIEASTVGSPKICGEFLAPPAIPLLKQWGVGPTQAIKEAQFLGGHFGRETRALHVSFPREAGAYSRHQAEMELAARAQTMGGRIIEHSPIKTIIPATQTSPFILHLVSGEIIQARDVIFATGKFSQLPAHKTKDTYVGFKTHIPQVIRPETLFMFGLSGGYLGVVPISAEVSNVTCLVKRDVIAKAGSCAAFFHHLTRDYAALNHCLDKSYLKPLDWLDGESPAFGSKARPHWPHAYWIGDAYASVHPAIGFGFAHSVTSAQLAVIHYLEDDPIGYHDSMQKIMRPKQMIGKCMHHLLQKPYICSAMSLVFGDNHWITQRLLKILDY